LKCIEKKENKTGKLAKVATIIINYWHSSKYLIYCKQASSLLEKKLFYGELESGKEKLVGFTSHKAR
jgi:hypothetical protein